MKLTMNIKPLLLAIPISILLWMLLFATVATFAQDETPAATDEPALVTEQVIATVTASDFVTPTEAATTTPFVVTATEAPATPEPQATQIIIVVTQPSDDSGNDGDTDETDEDTTDLPEGNVSIPGWSIVVVIVLGIAGGASVPGLIDRIRRDPRAIAEIEQRTSQLPAPVTDAANKFAQGLESFAGLLKEATDKIAAANKPSEAVNLSGVSSTELRTELIKRGELSAG